MGWPVIHGPPCIIWVGDMKKNSTLLSFVLSKYVYVLIFVVGAVAFAYPFITNMINMQTQTQVISNYEEEIAKLEESEKQKRLEEAEAYNKYVASLEGNVTDEITDQERAATDIVYMSVLTTGEAIGYVEIPKIDVELPIFRGATDDILERGIGHLERSSLPGGGESTHSVLSGHRGLPTSRLFRDLGLLDYGDIFFVETLGEKCAYEVENIQVVLPYEVESLRIQEGRDLCTLITCEPYMINSHRMLVTGHRVDYTEELENEAGKNGISFFEKYIEYFVIVGIVILLFFVIWLIRTLIKRRRQAVMASKNQQERDDDE